MQHNHHVEVVPHLTIERKTRPAFMNFNFKMHRSASALYDTAFKQFFIYELKNIYWVEKYLIKQFPKMAKAVYAEELKDKFDANLIATQKQVMRIENIFAVLGKKPRTKVCRSMKAIIKEGETIIKKTKVPATIRDAGIVLAGRKVEHYEIATYGEMIKLASSLRLNKVSQWLYMNLEEEMDADTNLRESADRTCHGRSAESKII